MSFKLSDRTRETASAPGTGTVTLLGAVSGYQSFSAGIGANNTTYYVIADQTGANWEVGLGTIGAGGTTLARTTVLSSSNSDSLVNFTSGTQDVFCDYTAKKAIITNDVGDVLVNQSTDQGTGVLQVTGQSTFNGVVTDKSLNLQGGNNLVLNSATLVTQNITVTANTYTLSMTGTGTITLSGTSSGTLVGTGASQVVSKTFTPTAGTLTLTPTGSCTTAQLELGSVFSGYTATGGTAVTTTNNINVPSGNVTVSNGQLFGTPSYTVPSFTNTSGSGFGYFGTTSIIFAGNATPIAFGSNAVNMTSGAYLGWTSNTSPATTAPDLTLFRDAANILAQRNSTNAQTFRLYNTYTDASNYERLSIDWSTTANTATIVTQNAGTGSARNLAIGQDLFVNSVRVGLGGGAVASNMAVGLGSLGATATGVNNTGVGPYTLGLLTSGTQNSAFGNSALYNNTTGSYNCAFGSSALLFNTTAANNSAFGTSALSSNTTGASNSAFGTNCLILNISGTQNVAMGLNSLYYNTAASNLVAVGSNSLSNNTSNVATLGAITGGSGYTNGTYTGVVMTRSSGSTAATYPTATIVVAGGVVTTVTITSAGVGFKDTTTVLTAPAASIGGTGSGFTVPVATLASGTGNVAVGYQAGYSNSVGTNNTLNGYQAGYSNIAGISNTFNGYQAGYSNNSSNNAFFGAQAGLNNTSATQNTALGSAALLSNSSGGGNVAVGYASLYSSTSATCSALGSRSGQGITSGGDNTVIGYQAGYTGTNNLTTGTANVLVGSNSAVASSANTNSIVIGANAVGLGSNTTVIGNTSTTLTQTYGVTKSTNYTVATLPSASTSGVGARAFVTDALAPVFGATVVTGGAVPTPVYSDGTNWKVG